MSAVAVELHDLPVLVGRDLGPTPWVPVDQESVSAFARTTLDDQWIHVDPQRAAGGPFGTTIVHGFMTLSLCSHFFGELLQVGGAGLVVNYGLDKVRFPSAVPVGARVRARGRLLSVDDRDGRMRAVTALAIEADGGTKPACVAEQISLFYPTPEGSP